jgi:pimeloyl-ACP methyl ester carboxylesterase
MESLHLVCLPATAPHDATYGLTPDAIAGYPKAAVHPIHFPTMVWYNAAVRRKAIAQIDALGLSSLALVGFSKSGLGAFNIARAIPDRVAATVIFDAPVVRETLPRWGTAPFYADDAEWLTDLPARHVDEWAAAMPAAHRLILISGEAFHDEIASLSGLLHGAGVVHTFLPRPDMRHHWQAGWLEEALAVLLG